MVLKIDGKKQLTKFSTHLFFKTLNKIRRKRKYLSVIKGIYEKTYT